MGPRGGQEELRNPDLTLATGTGTGYINSLADRCGLATNYHDITHPSLPN
jgi:hypothetical protein